MILSKFIAFLRAINIGGHIVKMDALRGLFESLGFSNVATFIRTDAGLKAIAAYKPLPQAVGDLEAQRKHGLSR